MPLPLIAEINAYKEAESIQRSGAGTSSKEYLDLLAGAGSSPSG
jgi:hypothetical protein